MNTGIILIGVFTVLGLTMWYFIFRILKAIYESFTESFKEIQEENEKEYNENHDK